MMTPEQTEAAFMRELFSEIAETILGDKITPVRFSFWSDSDRGWKREIVSSHYRLNLLIEKQEEARFPYSIDPIE